MNNKRFEILDALRGIAVLSVMLFHYLTVFDNEFGYNDKPIWNFKYGFWGVELFFIISGFVIYYSIEKSNNIKTFIINRFIRLYPTYFICLVITFSLISYFNLSTYRNTTIPESIVNLTMIQGLFGIKSVDTSYWSLQIELAFYFFISIIFMMKLGNRIVYVIYFWLLLIFIYNFLFKIPLIGLIMNLQYGMFFLTGMIFYRIKVLEENKMINHLLIFFCYILSLLILRKMDGVIWGVTLVYLVIYLALFDYLNFIKNRILFFLGNISYALYLIHNNIGLLILKKLKIMGFSNSFSFILPVTVSILLAWLITLYIEKNISFKLRQLLLSHL